MGLFGQSTAAKSVSATVLMAGYQAQCTLSILGLLQTFVNDEQKSVLPLEEVTLCGLEQGNPARSMSIPQLFIKKTGCHALAFDAEFSPDETGLMPRVETVAVYTSHFVIQGSYHMGTDTPVSDFVDATKALFIAATNVSIFPLFEPQSRVVAQARLVYIHRSQVVMHHAL